MKIISTYCIAACLFILSGCQTIENKSQSVVKKENEKLSKFLQQPESELKIALGEPDKIVKNDAGIILLIFKKK